MDRAARDRSSSHAVNYAMPLVAQQELVERNAMAKAAIGPYAQDQGPATFCFTWPTPELG
jgi:hypothetical protein